MYRRFLLIFDPLIFFPPEVDLLGPLWGPPLKFFLSYISPRRRFLDFNLRAVSAHFWTLYFFIVTDGLWWVMGDGWWVMGDGSWWEWKRFSDFASKFFQMKFRWYKCAKLWKICEKLFFIGKKSNFNFRNRGFSWSKMFFKFAEIILIIIPEMKNFWY